jgi:hypothetical protein
MPEVLERCVRKLMRKGHSKSSAYAICSESTGWKKDKGGGWKKSTKSSPPASTTDLARGYKKMGRF